MKLIIKEYLSSLKERDELDALLPDLLSQMGLNVISRPSRGTRQYGVDIAAVGKIENEPEKVYLFSVKSGDLGRKDWNSGSLQDLLPSLDEIINTYIPSHIPTEHKGKPIDICICMGGNVKEEVRLNITQYETAKNTDLLQIVEWDGDRLSSMIEKYFLREDLLPKDIRPLLRKSLALLDEPQSSFRNFSKLINNFTLNKFKNNSVRLTALRQMNICLWILFSWSRDANNLESAYLSSELTLLHAWEINKVCFNKNTKIAKSMQMTFSVILNTYLSISQLYLADKIIPYVGITHGLSTAVQCSEKIDVNLKMFDVLGRLAITGIWSYWQLSINENDLDIKKGHEEQVTFITESLKSIINNNPALFLPIKDDQVIEISLTLLFLSYQDGTEKFSNDWLLEMTNRSVFSYETHGTYPCIYKDYNELLGHPKINRDEYRHEATSGSVLYPTIGFWAAILGFETLYKSIQLAFEKHFQHSNFQIWYVNNLTENFLYTNSGIHGATFSHVPINLEANEYSETLWLECDG